MPYSLDSPTITPFASHTLHEGSEAIRLPLVETDSGSEAECMASAPNMVWLCVIKQY